MNKIIIGIIALAIIGGGWFLLNNNEIKKEGDFEVKTKIQENKANLEEKKVAVSHLEMEHTLEELAQTEFGLGKTITLYKSPSCGCCVKYEDILKEKGFTVKTVSTDDMVTIKNKYNIPADKQSCHTMEIDGYFIEGHVPFEAVAKLLKEKPAIDGIGLPNMPSGTPGMPGKQKAPYEVYQAKDNIYSSFISI